MVTQRHRLAQAQVFTGTYKIQSGIYGHKQYCADVLIAEVGRVQSNVYLDLLCLLRLTRYVAEGVL